MQGTFEMPAKAVDESYAMVAPVADADSDASAANALVGHCSSDHRGANIENGGTSTH